MNNTLLDTTSNTAQGDALPNEEVLTIVEVARFLRVPKSTVYKLARAGELPASKIGKHWRFLRQDIRTWVHQRSNQKEGIGDGWLAG